MKFNQEIINKPIITQFSFLHRDDRLKVGDEIINVCGKRLRGLCIDEAIKTLKQPSRDLDIVYYIYNNPICGRIL